MYKIDMNSKPNSYYYLQCIFEIMRHLMNSFYPE